MKNVIQKLSSDFDDIDDIVNNIVDEKILNELNETIGIEEIRGNEEFIDDE